jgi:hypothetical protein
MAFHEGSLSRAASSPVVWSRVWADAKISGLFILAIASLVSLPAYGRSHGDIAKLELILRATRSKTG